MRLGHTYTKDLAIEPRQHELLGLDLGEGPPRRLLGILAVACGLWWTLLGTLFGLPTQASVTWYLLPPVLLSWFGMQADPRLPRRRRITQWLLLLRYPLIGAAPIIRLGASPAGRDDQLPWRVRWGQLWHGWTELTESTPPAWADPPPDDQPPALLARLWLWLRQAGTLPHRRHLTIHRTAVILDDDALRRKIER